MSVITINGHTMLDLDYAEREVARRRAEYEIEQARADALWAVYQERQAAHQAFTALCDRVGVNAYAHHGGEARQIKDVLWAERCEVLLDWKYASRIAMAALDRVTNARHRAEAIYGEVVA